MFLCCLFCFSFIFHYSLSLPLSRTHAPPALHARAQDELMERVVHRYLEGVARDLDVDVRCRSAQLLVQRLTHSSSKWSTLVLALVNSILQHGLEVASKQVRMCVGGYHTQSVGKSLSKMLRFFFITRELVVTVRLGDRQASRVTPRRTR